MNSSSSRVSGGWVLVFACLLGLGTLLAAEERLPTLTIGDATYTNVMVTSVTATDIYFTHNRGVGNAKLKQLTPELQERFHYDPAKAALKQNQQTLENALYSKTAREAKLSRKPVPDAAVPRVQPRTGQNNDISAGGRQAPEIFVEKWITAQPDTNGKFVLLDFWATWCPPCRASIPKLNALHDRFNDRVVIIGLANETEPAIRRPGLPSISYTVATDTQDRTAKAVHVRSIPHALLIDPKGIVRFEGHPAGLDAKKLEELITKYGG